MGSFYPEGGGGGGVLPEKSGRGVRPAFQNPYPIYDQCLRFSLPYLWMHVQYAVVVCSSVFASEHFLLYPGQLGADQFLDEEKVAQQRAIYSNTLLS